MIVLLHSHHPRYIVKGDGAQTEVCVIRDLVDFFDEAVEVGRGDAVDGGDEVGRGETILVGGRSATLGFISK